MNRKLVPVQAGKLAPMKMEPVLVKTEMSSLCGNLHRELFKTLCTHLNETRLLWRSIIEHLVKIIFTVKLAFSRYCSPLSTLVSREFLTLNLQQAPNRWPQPQRVRETNMNNYQKQLVQSSFRQLVPMADQVAIIFYDRLFMLDPSLRSLFKGDMNQQGLKLMHTLQLAVNALHNLDEILPALQRLGKSHVGYGVQDEHYEKVGEALIWTIEQGVGATLSDEVREAWVEAYELLSSAMMEAVGTEKAMG